MMMINEESDDNDDDDDHNLIQRVSSLVIWAHYNDERDTADQGMDDDDDDGDDDDDDITEGNITVIFALLLNITSLLPRAMHLSGLDSFLPVFSSQDGIVFFLSSLPWFHWFSFSSPDGRRPDDVPLVEAAG